MEERKTIYRLSNRPTANELKAEYMAKEFNLKKGAQDKIQELLQENSLMYTSLAANIAGIEELLQRYGYDQDSLSLYIAGNGSILRHSKAKIEKYLAILHGFGLDEEAFIRCSRVISADLGEEALYAICASQKKDKEKLTISQVYATAKELDAEELEGLIIDYPLTTRRKNVMRHMYYQEYGISPAPSKPTSRERKGK